MKNPRELHRVRPGKGKVDLGRCDPAWTPGFGKDGKEEAKERLAKDAAALDRLQQMLYAEGRRALLVVFQAMDTAGKDGVIRGVFGPLNSAGVVVHAFKKPTVHEVARDYLWRVHQAVPPKGTIAIFNRSQYEDILVPTVFETLPRRQVEARYEQINRFERHLADNGTTILKFFLHISKEEQKERLKARLDDKAKNWKFDPADLKMRERWDAFMKAYGRILGRTSTDWAPWFVIPANRKWYRNAAVARIVREALEQMRPRVPPPPDGLEKVVIPD